MVRYLVENGANVNATTNLGYTPLHQASQQGRVLIIDLLLGAGAQPNATTNHGQTALNIAQKLGYISVIETLKIVTETTIVTTTVTTIEEKYRVVAPEAMQEVYMSDSEDEGGEDPIMSDQQQYKYMTADGDKLGADDSLKIDVTHDERDHSRDSYAGGVNEYIVNNHHVYNSQHSPNNMSVISSTSDNVDIARTPVHVG
ncbi:ankyrin-3-like isoform X1 [Diaphorina citri]|uniref:Ankyrin-3-like isoform X1 n=1 Tax=Diaphorina citri TaxID=121845 RepID=A0A1S3DIR6_DIACI|nr:ankyrin-3-like isoform X1 [Diaphorina citri]